MLKGEKHFALFHDTIPADGHISEEIIPEKAFAPYISNGTMHRFCKDIDDGAHIVRYVCYTNTGNEWRAHAFLSFHEEAINGKRPFDDAYEYFVGRLLGYSEEDIADYLRDLTSLHKVV